jgi:hypothetical protein
MCLLRSARSKNHVFLLRPHFLFCFSQPVALPRPPVWADIRQDFRGKGASVSESAPSGGYPLALADIRQGIAGIRDRYPLTISSWISVTTQS